MKTYIIGSVQEKKIILQIEEKYPLKIIFLAINIAIAINSTSFYTNTMLANSRNAIELCKT